MRGQPFCTGVLTPWLPGTSRSLYAIWYPATAKSYSPNQLVSSHDRVPYCSVFLYIFVCVFFWNGIDLVRKEWLCRNHSSGSCHWKPIYCCLYTMLHFVHFGHWSVSL